MNVLTVTNTLDFGGTAKNAIILHNNISKHANTLFLSFEDGVRRRQVNGDCKIIGPGHLLDHVQEQDADIVHFHGASIEPFSQEELQKIPNIVKTANFGWPDYNPEVDLFLFPSKMTLLRYSIIDGRNQAKKCRLLYHPVPDMKTSADPTNHSGKKLSIGMLGRPDSGKRSSIGFNAFMKILEEDAERDGLLLNPPQYRVEKLRKNDILNQVSIKENAPVGTISDFYSKINALIHSSAPGESFGYVLAEAQISETVPITNSTPMRDNAQIEIIKNRKSGYIANNVESYVKGAKKAEEVV